MLTIERATKRPRGLRAFVLLAALAVAAVAAPPALAERHSVDDPVAATAWSQSGAPTSGCWARGALVIDADGVTWQQTSAVECPGTWVQLQTGATAANAVTADPAGIAASSATDVQAVLEDMDDVLATTQTYALDAGTAAATAQAGATLALARTPGVRHALPLVVTPVSGSPDCTSPFRDASTGAVIVRCTGGANGDVMRVGACTWLGGDTLWASAGATFNYALSDGTGNNRVKIQIYDGDDTTTACYAGDVGGTATAWTARTVSGSTLTSSSCAVAGWTCVEAYVTLDAADTVDLGLYSLAVQ